MEWPSHASGRVSGRMTPPGPTDKAGSFPPARAGAADATPAADWLDATGLPGEPG